MAGGLKPGAFLWIVCLLGLVLAASVLDRRMDRGERQRPNPVPHGTAGARAYETVPGPPPDPRDRGTQARVGSRDRDPGPDAVPDSLPEYGKFVHVEELPEAIERVAPKYPDRARELGLEGSVIVGALIGRDGRVIDTRIVRSTPPFDAPAEAAVRRWTFRPARSHGKPVAAWVAVPVRFALH